MDIGAKEIGVAGGILGLITFFLRFLTPKSFADLKSEVDILKKQMGLFWGVVEKQMSTLLHSPHRPSLDVLLEKNTKGESLTEKEAERLVELLQNLIKEKDISTNEVSYATMLMAVTVAKYGVAA